MWAEIAPSRLLLAASEVEVASPFLEPFRAIVNGVRGTQTENGFAISADVIPLREPIESVPAVNLTEIRFAVLDSPTVGDLVQEQQPRLVLFPCGQFDLRITDVSIAHSPIQRFLGDAPRRMTNSGSLTQRGGGVFTSNDGRMALDTANEALSFAAGRWVGFTLIEGINNEDAVCWFRWGATKMSPARQLGWFDPRHSDWLTSLGDGLLRSLLKNAPDVAF